MAVESARFEQGHAFVRSPKDSIKSAVDRVTSIIPWEKNHEALTAANKLLHSHSLLVALNHPGYLDTFLSVHTILTSLNISETTSVNILMSEALCGNETRNFKASVIKKLCSLWDIHTLPVYLAKKGWSKTERNQNNMKTVRKTLEILNKPGNIVIMFPEAYINPTVLEAERGLGEFMTHTDSYTLPVTSNFHTYLYEPVLSTMPSPLVIHQPISNRELTRIAGKENRQTMSDLILTTIASALPSHQQGFYSTMAQALERTDEPAHERSRKVVELQRKLFQANTDSEEGSSGFDPIPQAI